MKFIFHLRVSVKSQSQCCDGYARLIGVVYLIRIAQIDANWPKDLKQYICHGRCSVQMHGKTADSLQGAQRDSIVIKCLYTRLLLAGYSSSHGARNE